jgi:hypothetical protein
VQGLLDDEPEVVWGLSAEYGVTCYWGVRDFAISIAAQPIDMDHLQSSLEGLETLDAADGAVYRPENQTNVYFEVDDQLYMLTQMEFGISGSVAEPKPIDDVVELINTFAAG